MISIKISEVKSFMAKLLANTMFDTFYMKELEIQTFTTFHVTGQFNEEFFSKEEMEEREGKRIVLWSEVRAIAFSMIKGNKTPTSMKVVFQLPSEKVEKMLQGLSGKLRPEEVGGLFLNIRFDKGELHIITGTAIKTFTMDKTLEQEWDSWVQDFLKQQEIAYEVE